MSAHDLPTLTDDDLDRLLDDAEHQASTLPDIQGKQPLNGTRPQISNQPTQGKQDTTQSDPSPQNPGSKQLTESRPRPPNGNIGAKGRKAGPGRPKGLLIGKYTQKRQQRDMQVIAAALGVEAARQNPAGLGQVGPRDYFQAILDNPAAPPEERRDAAKQLAAIDARGKEVAKVEEINWDNLTSAQRRQGIDACKLLTDLRHISHKRDPEFGMV